jgi:hypothetical protein
MGRRQQDSRLIDVSAVVRVERPAAWLLYDGKIEVWVPKSQAEKNSDGTFTMPEWLAKEKGLI